MKWGKSVCPCFVWIVFSEQNCLAFCTQTWYIAIDDWCWCIIMSQSRMQKMEKISLLSLGWRSRWGLLLFVVVFFIQNFKLWLFQCLYYSYRLLDILYIYWTACPFATTHSLERLVCCLEVEGQSQTRVKVQNFLEEGGLVEGVSPIFSVQRTALEPNLMHCYITCY